MRSFVFQVFKHMCVCCCDLSSRGLFSSYVFRGPLSAGQHLKAPYETMPHACHMMRMDTLHAAKGQCREVASGQDGWGSVSSSRKWACSQDAGVLQQLLEAPPLFECWFVFHPVLSALLGQGRVTDLTAAGGLWGRDSSAGTKQDAAMPGSVWPAVSAGWLALRGYLMSPRPWLPACLGPGRSC